MLINNNKVNLLEFSSIHWMMQYSSTDEYVHDFISSMKNKLWPDIQKN